jgi:hypothetical protein
MLQQATDTVLMIEPAAFGYNTQTAVNNFFQQTTELSVSETQAHALEEFNAMTETLQLNGIRVISVKDTLVPHTPDSIFPNNWISFHEDGTVVLYPMFAENRRDERRIDILSRIENEGFVISKIIDYSHFENDSLFLEGTGSMVLDRVNHKAYAAMSERTSSEILRRFCDDNRYSPVEFSAWQTIDGKWKPVYHTNVMLCVADSFAVVCLQTVKKPDERRSMLKSLLSAHKEIVEISEEQMHCFAGNMLQLQNTDGENFIAMSETAFASLTSRQTELILRHCKILRFNIPTIEKIGGGGVRCMMAEVFLPKTI